MLSLLLLAGNGVRFCFSTVCDFVFCLFVNHVSRELLNGFVPNSQGRRVWSLAQTGLNVKVTRGKKRTVHPRQQRNGPVCCMQRVTLALSRGCLHAVYVWKTSLLYYFGCTDLRKTNFMYLSLSCIYSTSIHYYFSLPSNT